MGKYGFDLTIHVDIIANCWYYINELTKDGQMDEINNQLKMTSRQTDHLQSVKNTLSTLKLA